MDFWKKKKDNAPTAKPIVWDDDQSIRVRRYASYEAYLDHQASKLRTLNLIKYTISFKDALRKRLEFIQARNIKRGASVLCLGARNGAECEVFIELDFFAVGVDLNPGVDNKHVVYGDFHKLQFSDGTVDIVFTNALDHAFDLDLIISEVYRVLKPGGLFIAEIVRGSKDPDGREPGAYESAWWEQVDSVVDRISSKALTIWKRKRFDCPWVGDQCVFTK